jgi:hypothetical protein
VISEQSVRPMLLPRTSSGLGVFRRTKRTRSELQRQALPVALVRPQDRSGEPGQLLGCVTGGPEGYVSATQVCPGRSRRGARLVLNRVDCRTLWTSVLAAKRDEVWPWEHQCIAESGLNVWGELASGPARTSAGDCGRGPDSANAMIRPAGCRPW